MFLRKSRILAGHVFVWSIVLFSFTLFFSSASANDKAAKIDKLAQQYHDARLFNGALLVAENGKVIFKKGYGYANMEWQIPNAPDVKYRIGSVTKQFTAILILQLMEQGKIKLDGTISQYLPEYPEATGNKITIHQLLNHTSGIPSYTGFPNFENEISRDPYQPMDFISLFNKKELEFEPGSQFSYNNSAYFLLGVIIEKIVGKPYEQVLQERILTPMGLQNTGYDRSERIIPNRASGYTKTLTGYLNATYLDMSLPYSAGSLYSTVEDLYQWDQVLYTDKLFKNPATKALLFKPGLSSYGYGYFIRQVPVGKADRMVNVIEHGGGINGFVTGFRRFVDDQHLIAVVDNSEQGQERLMTGIADILYGEQADSPKKSIAEALLNIIEKNDLQAGIAFYKSQKEKAAEAYNFSESELNALGYHYLRSDDIDAAQQIFKLNIEMFPEGANTYDSYAESLAEAGDKEGAIANYQKSLDLNPGNRNAIEKLKELGVEIADKEIAVAPVVLDQLAGEYEIQPGFVLTVTHENGRLYTQATGQSRFEIFPSTEYEWFVKAFNAQISFHAEQNGSITSLTLRQGGRDVPAKRIK